MLRTKRLTAAGCERCRLPAALLAISLALAGCNFIPDVRHQERFHNPFPQLHRVAVLPFRNQSEEPTLSGADVSAAYAHELQAVPGFEVLPLGAVQNQLAYYEQQVLQRPAATTDDFRGFAAYLGVDAVLQGAVTDFEPYYPPRLTLKVNWYAANPAYHPIPAGYGLPWGEEGEEDIPEWVRLEAERELAAEQLAIITPPASSTEQMDGPVVAAGATELPQLELAEEPAAAAWPDPEGFIPPAPAEYNAAAAESAGPVIEHMAAYNGSDEDFTYELEQYYYFRDDERFGGWEAYLQRSEDFIRFCCHLHLKQTLTARGGALEKRTAVRWPIRRYER